MSEFLDVKQITSILIKKNLAKDANGTRRFIRRGEITAEKASNHSGYRVSRKALDAFLLVKQSNTQEIVSKIQDLEAIYEKAKKSSKFQVASFFAGIGGFDLGCEKAGMNVVFQCELNSFARSVLQRHWPTTPLHDDINTLEEENIPESNVWCGGFPCQDLSLANQGKRKGLNGERSGLFYKFAELVGRRKPKWLILENVPGLLNSHSGRDFQILLSRLDELGYGISWRVLDAKYFGTPQRRRRVYVVGSFGDISSSRVLFEQGSTSIVDKQGLGQRENSSGRITRCHGKANFYAIQHAGIGRKHTAGPQAKGYRKDGETYTLDSRGSSDAVCSPHDAFRVRNAPRVSSRLDSARYRAIGNAVAVPVVEWIASRIIRVENLTVN